MAMEYKAEQRVRLRRLKDDDAAAGMLRAEGVVKVEPVRRDVPLAFTAVSHPCAARCSSRKDSRRVQFLGEGGEERKRETERKREGERERLVMVLES